MLDTLIHRQDGKVTSARETSMVEERLKGTQNCRRTIRVNPDAIDKIRSW